MSPIRASSSRAATRTVSRSLTPWAGSGGSAAGSTPSTALSPEPVAPGAGAGEEVARAPTCPVASSTPLDRREAAPAEDRHGARLVAAWSTPTAGTPRRGEARRRAPARNVCVSPPCGRAGRATTTASSGARRRARTAPRRGRRRRGRARGPAARDELARELAAELLAVVRSCEVARLGVGPERVVDRLGVERHAEGAHGRTPAARVVDRAAGRSRRRPGRPSRRRRRRPRCPSRRPRTRSGYDGAREVVERLSPRTRGLGRGRRRRPARCAARRSGDCRFSRSASLTKPRPGEADADEDPEHERDEDRCQRRDVVAQVEHGRSLGRTAPAAPRQRPSALPIARPSDWSTLRSAGEASTATTIAAIPVDGEDGERPDADPRRDEPRDALRVDERLADLEPRDERRRHALAVALEELDEIEVRADRDDQAPRRARARAGGRCPR